MFFLSKLAICVPTYQRLNNIKNICANELPLFDDLGIDLYIIDSSIDDDTEKFVKSKQVKYKILFYIRFDKEIDSNTKVYKILQMAGEQIKCDYIWIRSDALFSHELLIRGLIGILNKNKYDFLVLNPHGRFLDNALEDVLEIDDRQILFENYTWILTMYGTAILSVKRMLSLVDWGYMTSRYLKDDCINYSHVCLFFEIINIIKQPKILVINTQFFFGSMPNQISSWIKETFYITLVIWPNAIKLLPDAYINKNKVIHTLLDIAFFRYRSLEFLKDIGILTPKLAYEYRNEIEEYTNISFDDVYAISEGEILHKEIREPLEYYPLIDFARKYERLVIYGCGKRAKRYAGYLLENGIDFEAFLVTKVHNNVDNVLDHPVLQAGQYKFTRDIGVIMGLKIEYQREVFSYMRAKNLLEQTFSYPVTFSELKSFLDKLEKFTL